MSTSRLWARPHPNIASTSPCRGRRRSAAPSRGRMKNMSSISKQSRGFTLVEMLVASVMGVLFLGLLYGSFLPVLDVASASSSKVDTLGAATTALYQIEADV